MKRLNDAGIFLPDGEMKSSKQIISSGATKSIQIETMEMILTLPELTGSYQPVPDTEAGLVEAYRRQKLLTYTWKPAIQFVVRANEAAYFRFGIDEDGNGRVAYWMKKCSWRPWRKNNRCSLYNQMVLGNNMSLLYRLKTKTENVSAE